MGSALRNYAVPDSVVPKSMYDANSVLVAVSDNDPAAVALSASSFIGRKATGNAGAMTAAEAAQILPGAVVQIQHAQTGALISGSTTTPCDDTIPQVTEGIEILTCAITPKSTSNLLLIHAICNGIYNTAANKGAWALFMAYDGYSSTDALAVTTAYMTTTTYSPVTLMHKMSVPVTSEITFSMRLGAASSGTMYVNTAHSTGRGYGGVAATTLTIIEMNP